jgi:hypothetical protein
MKVTKRRQGLRGRTIIEQLASEIEEKKAVEITDSYEKDDMLSI